MNESNRPTNYLPQVLTVLVTGAVPLAAFLAFAIQPMMGKRLLPIYGGSSGTWLGCMVYFQLTLLVGYSWAAWLVRKSISFQAIATAALAVLAVLTFQLPSDQADATASIGRVVWRLSYTSLPAMVLLFGTSPLLHGWMRRRGEEVPYYLYSISNAGSLLAVLLYPFLIETSLRLSDQVSYWQALLFIVAGALVAAGYILKRITPNSAETPIVAETAEALAPGQVLLWLWLSTLTCVGMLGATYHLAAELGSSPLAWVGPFSVYLFSFMVAFAGRWRPWMTMTTIVWLAISLTGFMVTKGFTASTVNGATARWLLSLTASGSLLGNGLLYGARPAQRFERYYLILAAGGVLGGLLSSAVIPYYLSRPIEFELASVALLITGLLWMVNRREPAIAIVVGIVLFVPVVGLGIHQINQEAPNAVMDHFRDLYGHIMVRTDGRSVVLSSDTTSHGSQLTMDAAARRRPTLYFTESTGLGRTIERLQATRPTMRVGVIGLGAGTVAAYARPSDVYDFWDIDPKILRVARTNFSYVADSAGKVNLVVRDGRKALEESKADYDLILVDAFTGDGVPSHLLTAEAMAIYFRRLAPRDGLLVVHASTRYSSLFPVVDATARTLNHAALDVVTDIRMDRPDRDWDPTHTEYIIVCRPERAKEVLTWFPSDEEKGRVKRLVSTIETNSYDAQHIWTDDRNAALDTLDLGHFLFGP